MGKIAEFFLGDGNKQVVPTPVNLPETEPKWAKELRGDLTRVAGALGQMALSDELRKDVIAAQGRMSEERRKMNERVDAIQQFVETGKSCTDCRATRRLILDRMRDVIINNSHVNNDSLDAGNGYPSRTLAFRAGWELAINRLKNVVSEIEKSLN